MAASCPVDALSSTTCAVRPTSSRIYPIQLNLPCVLTISLPQPISSDEAALRFRFSLRLSSQRNSYDRETISSFKILPKQIKPPQSPHQPAPFLVFPRHACRLPALDQVEQRRKDQPGTSKRETLSAYLGRFLQGQPPFSHPDRITRSVRAPMEYNTRWNKVANALSLHGSS
jgi:hypothetical protein